MKKIPELSIAQRSISLSEIPPPERVAAALTGLRERRSDIADVFEFMSLTGVRWGEVRAIRASWLGEIPLPQLNVERSHSGGYDEKDPKILARHQVDPAVPSGSGDLPQACAREAPGRLPHYAARKALTESPDTPRTLGRKFSPGASRKRIGTLRGWASDQGFCAETEGFEPSEPLRVLHLSRVCYVCRRCRNRRLPHLKHVGFGVVGERWNPQRTLEPTPAVSPRRGAPSNPGADVREHRR